jgi:hypothetical protein
VHSRPPLLSIGDFDDATELRPPLQRVMYSSRLGWTRSHNSKLANADQPTRPYTGNDVTGHSELVLLLVSNSDSCVMFSQGTSTYESTRNSSQRVAFVAEWARGVVLDCCRRKCRRFLEYRLVLECPAIVAGIEQRLQFA